MPLPSPRRSAALALAALTAGCASSPPPGPSWEERVAGCYELAPGPWETDPALARFYPPGRVPRRFRLETRPMVGWAHMQSDTMPHRFADEIPSPGPRRMFSYWIRLPRTDSIHVNHPMPMGGAALHLTPRGRDLAGRVRTHTDAIGPDGVTEATAPVVARRIRCPE